MNPTPHRTIRVPDELWRPFITASKASGSDASTILRELIAGWLKEHEGEK